MGKRFDFTIYTPAERDEIAEALPKDQKAVFLSRWGGASVIQTSFDVCQSEATVKRNSAKALQKIRRMHAMQRGQTTTEYQENVIRR